LGHYDVALICLNGHIINSIAKSEPQQNEKFCTTCGESTIAQCPDCESEIRGQYCIDDWLEFGDNSSYFERPSFCSNCGKPFPWTSSRIQAAQEYALELDGLTEEERKLLKKSIPDLVKDSPQTIVAVSRFKKIVSKLGSTTSSVFKDILIDVLKDGVKKSLWG
jgi:hypothetical protein